MESFYDNTTLTMHLNVTYTPNVSLNNNGSESECGKVDDIQRDMTTRLVILYLTILLGLLGGVLVLLWMAYNRKVSPRFNHLSRVNSFILNLTFSDLFVIFGAVLPQLLWEYADRDWQTGPVMCKLLKFIQGFAMMSSNYILVVIAIDRHQAIRAPLKESWPVSMGVLLYLHVLVKCNYVHQRHGWLVRWSADRTKFQDTN